MSNLTNKEQLLAMQELEWRRICDSKTGFEYFLKTYCYMWSKEGGDAVKWIPWDCQIEAAQLFQKKKMIICLKTRQIGMSWVAVAYALYKSITKKNFHTYVTSIGLKECAEQFMRIQFIYDNLPQWLREKVVMGGRKYKNNDSLKEFSNKSAIHAVSSKSSSGHGSAPGLYILDEFSRKEKDKEAWRAIKPSLGAKSQVVIVSTSDGRNNLFYELWRDAESGNNNFYPLFFPASSHPDYTEEYLEGIKLDFAHDMIGYYQAFPKNPEEAFMASSRSVFDHLILEKMSNIITESKLIPLSGLVETDDQGKRKFEPSVGGAFSMWESPQPGIRYTVGADVAEGLTNGDWSVAVVVRVDTMEVVAMYRAKVDPENYAYPLEQISRFYNESWLVVEMNKSADYILSELKANYQNLYCRQVRKNIYDIPTLEPGFRTTSATKPRIIMQLRKAMARSENNLKIYSKVIIKELEAYEQDERGSLNAPRGAHDDCVMALALAIEGTTTVPLGTAGMTDMQIETKTMNWRSL